MATSINVTPTASWGASTRLAATMATAALVGILLWRRVSWGTGDDAGPGDDAGLGAESGWLVYRCTGVCGGWADRLKGISTVFLLSKLTGRRFAIHSPMPADISLWLKPTVDAVRSGLDWSQRPAVQTGAGRVFRFIDQPPGSAVLAELLGARDSVVTVETNLDLLPYLFTLPQWRGADVPAKIMDRVQALGLVPAGCTLTNPAKSGAAAKNSSDCLQAAKENYMSKCYMGQCGAAVGYVYSELFELQPRVRAAVDQLMDGVSMAA